MPRFSASGALALFLLAAPGCGPSSPDAVPPQGPAPTFDAEKSSAYDASRDAPPDSTPPEPAPPPPAESAPTTPLSDGLDESGEIVAFTPDTSIPTYHGTVGEVAPELVRFLQDNLGNEVDLRISFSSTAPYDYRGGEGLSLWYANDSQGETLAGVFFECEGSFDRRTGYAAQGRIEGVWTVSEVKRLGGDPHYTLVCETP